MTGTGFAELAKGSATSKPMPPPATAARRPSPIPQARIAIRLALAPKCRRRINNSAWNFASVQANSSGGHDLAALYGATSGDNQLAADNLSASLSNTGFSNIAKGFEKVNVFGNSAREQQRDAG